MLVLMMLVDTYTQAVLMMCLVLHILLMMKTGEM